MTKLSSTCSARIERLHSRGFIPNEPRRIAICSCLTQITHIAREVTKHILRISSANHISETEFRPGFYRRTLVEITNACIHDWYQAAIFWKGCFPWTAQSISVFRIDRVELIQHGSNLTIIEINTAEVYIDWRYCVAR